MYSPKKECLWQHSNGGGGIKLIIMIVIYSFFISTVTRPKLQRQQLSQMRKTLSVIDFISYSHPDELTVPSCITPILLLMLTIL